MSTCYGMPPKGGPFNLKPLSRSGLEVHSGAAVSERRFSITHPPLSVSVVFDDALLQMLRR